MEKSLDPQCAELLEDAKSILQSTMQTETDLVYISRTYTQRLLSTFSILPAQGVLSEDILIPSHNGNVPMRLYQPTISTNKDIIVFFHGGGWSVGDMDSYDPFIRTLCLESNTAFLSIDYRLAPEAKYPAAHDDCQLATDWVVSNAASLGYEPNKVSLMGDSAGGTIATCIAAGLAGKEQHNISALYLLYPFLDLSDQHQHYHSRLEYGDGEYLIGRDGLSLATRWYLNDEDDRLDPKISPMFLSDMGVLPSTIIITAGFDPLAQEGKIFANRAKQAGVPVSAKHFDSAIHGFLPFTKLDVAQQARDWLVKKIIKNSTQSV